MLDWDGTAVTDRHADAGALRELVEAACAAAIDVAIVSGTNVGNVDGQLGARPRGPGELHLLLNRGSEVYLAGRQRPRLLERRLATAAEDRALDTAAQAVADELTARGLAVRIVARRLNRRKIDLIPEPGWADPPKAAIAELLAAVRARLRAGGIDDLDEVVALARSASIAAGLPGARITSDAKHVEIGLTDKCDSARWYFDRLWRRGIAPGQTIVVGDELGPLGGVAGSDAALLARRCAAAVSVGIEPAGVPAGVVHVGGGPAALLELLSDQLARRARHELPPLAADAAWTLEIAEIDPRLERVHESQLTVADGRIGTTGAPISAHHLADPTVFCAGVYRGQGAASELLPAPLWNRVALAAAPRRRVRRTLDLHAGVLHQRLSAPGGGQVEAMLFSSLARPGTAVLRARGPRDALRPGEPLVAVDDVAERGRVEEADWMRVEGDADGLVVAATQDVVRDDDVLALDRVASFRPHRGRPLEPATVVRELHDATGAGFDALLAAHRATWGERWNAADVRIDGDPELQHAVRFALFHLMASVGTHDEAAVGARGLAGPGYRGHVFWDADVFVLPFLAATHPPAARAMLDYRVRRLGRALTAARTAGRQGARFPWESARTGEDVTPAVARSRSGESGPVQTGPLEEHIVADVAWAAACYVDWTGDRAFAEGAGLRLLVETARYWASRIERDGDGTAHLRGVIGPDEYHEPVDDNAFTNVMARWNLRRAVADRRRDGRSRRARGVARLADALVDGYDATGGLYEQFAGFHALEPLMIAEVAPQRPVAADLLLGRERCAGAQVVKQADVLMLHYLLPDEVAPGSLAANLEHYEPRTAHGSSLSPGVHAALLMRLRRWEEALALLRTAARIDLDDIGQTTAGGLHVAAMGSVWRTLVWGFAGLRPAGAALALDPRLPPDWAGIELRVTYRGIRARIAVDGDGVSVACEGELAVVPPGENQPVTVHGNRRFPLAEAPAR